MEPASQAGPDGTPGQAQWPGTRRLTGALLAAWCVVTFVLAYFARDLHFHLFGWPFSFWLGAQGGLVAYLAITWAYAWRMAALDRAGDPGDSRG